MSHTVSNSPSSLKFWPYLVTIVNYTLGGETFTLADFGGITTLYGTILGLIPASANSLAVPLFPILDGAKVRLFQFVGGSPTEVPTTVALNASFSVLLMYT